MYLDFPSLALSVPDAVFKLKALLGDPSFADAFIQAEGLAPLRDAVLDTTGNTQAYALGSLNALLELDMGWECCDEEMLDKVGVLGAVGDHS